MEKQRTQRQHSKLVTTDALLLTLLTLCAMAGDPSPSERWPQLVAQIFEPTDYEQPSRF